MWQHHQQKKSFSNFAGRGHRATLHGDHDLMKLLLRGNAVKEIDKRDGNMATVSWAGPQYNFQLFTHNAEQLLHSCWPQRSSHGFYPFHWLASTIIEALWAHKLTKTFFFIMIIIFYRAGTSHCSRKWRSWSGKDPGRSRKLPFAQRLRDTTAHSGSDESYRYCPVPYQSRGRSSGMWYGTTYCDGSFDAKGHDQRWIRQRNLATYYGR